MFVVVIALDEMWGGETAVDDEFVGICVAGEGDEDVALA